jgi:hypothetical protein
MFCVDDDDPTLSEYQQLPNVVVGQRKRLAPTLNDAALAAVDQYGIIGFMGDDHLPRTHGWDVQVAEAIGSPGIAYGNDLLQGAALPTAVFVTSNIIKSIGYMCAPGLLHMYLDDTWKAWGDGADCLTYLPDVIIEHMHPGNNKAQHDFSYRESEALMEPDKHIYIQYAQTALAEDVERIRRLR